MLTNHPKNKRTVSNYSIRLESRADRRKRRLHGLIRGKALACAGMHDRAHRGNAVASPRRAHPVGARAHDGTPADGVRAGVRRGGKGHLVSPPASGALELGRALLPPAAVRVGRLTRATAADTPRPSTAGRLPGGGGAGVTTRGEGTRAPAHRLHPRRPHRLPRREGQRTIPPWMGSTDGPWCRRVLRWRPRAVRHPEGRALVAEDCVDAPVAWAGAQHRPTAVGMLNDPGPLGASVHAGTGVITAAQPATPQARPALRHPVGQPPGHPPAESRPGAVAAGHPRPRRPERRPARVTDGLGRSP
jgi:hypothetical protein